VGLGPAPVVRLERALGHESLQLLRGIGRARVRNQVGVPCSTAPGRRTQRTSGARARQQEPSGMACQRYAGPRWTVKSAGTWMSPGDDPTDVRLTPASTRVRRPAHPPGVSRHHPLATTIAHVALFVALRGRQSPRRPVALCPPYALIARLRRSPHTGCGQRCGSRTAVPNSTTRATTGSEETRVITGRSTGPYLGRGGR
jgi:hypothetical protein